MSSRSGWSLLASNAAVAAVGAAAMFAIVHTVYFNAPRTDVHEEPRPERLVLSSPHVDRLAFVSPGALSLGETAVPAPVLRSSLPPDEVTTEPGAADAEETVAVETPAWATETKSTPQTAKPAPAAPSYRFPWQWKPAKERPRHYTLKARLAELGPAASERLAKRFEAAKAPWPPAEIVLIAIKDEKVVELHARPRKGPWTLVHRYRVLAASGKAGPKLVQGDKQVPEGLYRISFLNPNSAYHVSLRVNYPNAFDLKMAKKEGRKDLGGDIMIHGKNLSAGCLAVGDEAAEELFVLAARTGLSRVKLIIAPTDLRHKKPPEIASQPEWLPALYTEIASAMTPFDVPQNIATSSTSTTPTGFSGIMALFGK